MFEEKQNKAIEIRKQTSGTRVEIKLQLNEAIKRRKSLRKRNCFDKAKFEYVRAFHARGMLSINKRKLLAVFELKLEANIEFLRGEFNDSM